VGFSLDGTVLAISSSGDRVTFWYTKTWQMQGEAIKCQGGLVQTTVGCVRYLPSGELLAIATIWNI
jgi:hypothetical protein